VITGEIFVGYFEEDFRENIDHYILLVDINLQTNILKQFEIHFEFRASLRIFQNLNFWDATTMLGEYNTPERFWSEDVNTSYHAMNWLFLHRLLKKTSYELLTGNKPNVSYFHVFGSKCYILVKRGRHSKFAPKVVKGFLLGCDSNTKAYRVFKKSLGLVEVNSDIVFDETNGSPREQVGLDDIDEYEVPTGVIRTMAVGDVRPQEHQE
jgi:hypothetical protein